MAPTGPDDESKAQAKEFGKLTADQLETVLAMRRSALEMGSQVPELLRHPRLRKLLARKSVQFHWSWAYELEFSEMLALQLLVSGDAGMVTLALGSPDPQQHVIDSVSALDESPKRARASQLLLVLSLLMANFYAVKAVGLYAKTMNQLIREGNSGDDESFINAARIDPTSLAAPSFAKRMSIAAMKGDKKLLRRVAKATVEGPHKALKVFDELRYAAVLLEESGGFRVASRSKVFETLVDRLGLYEARKGDPMKGLFRNLDLWRKASTT